MVECLLLAHRAGVVEKFAEKPGKGALQELSKGSRYSTADQPFEVRTYTLSVCQAFQEHG